MRHVWLSWVFLFSNGTQREFRSIGRGSILSTGKANTTSFSARLVIRSSPKNPFFTRIVKMRCENGLVRI